MIRLGSSIIFALLRRCGGVLDLRGEVGCGSALLEHRRVRRKGEQVLREPVVDLARESRTFIRHGTAELRRLDRTPHADAEHAVAEDTQEVAGRNLHVPQQRREHEMQRREQHQRRAEREPAVEVVEAIAEPQAEADDRGEAEDRVRRVRGCSR